jgi:hypothetical protein
VYITYTPYDGCDSLHWDLTPEYFDVGLVPAKKVPQIRQIAWAGMLSLAPGAHMKSLREGLIPNEAVIKLRVDDAYKTWWSPANPTHKSAHPKYLIRIHGKEAVALNAVQVQNALDSVKAVPNQYYGFSDYETTAATATVKITNLPAKCTVTIYTLTGKFVRQFNRDEVYMTYDQIPPDLEWDLKNSHGYAVASGVYLIRVEAPDMGGRTIKWFGITRKTGL